MKLKVKKTSKEVQARLFLILAAATDRNIKELESLLHLVFLLRIIDINGWHRVGVASHDTDSI